MQEYNDKIKQKRDEILKERQKFQKEKDSWEQLFIEEKTRLEKEIQLLQKYKEIQINKNIKTNEEQKLSELKDEYDCKDIKTEIENIKSLYNTKLSKIENQKKILEEEKEKFEKYKDDMNNNLEVKKMEIEQKKLELLKQNSEINQRYNDLRNKEVYLKDKYEDYQKIKAFVEAKEKQNYQNERDLKLAAARIQDNIIEINKKEDLLEKQKTDLLRKIREAKEQQKKIENDKMNVEHEKTELNLRYQYLNTFSYRSPDLNYLNNNRNMSMPLINDNNDVTNNNIGFNNMYNDYGRNSSEYNYNNYERFNADKYINNVKNRIENGKRIYYHEYRPNGGKLDIAKEREYISKNNMTREKNIKKY